MAVSQTLPINQTPINLTAALSRAAVLFSSISSQRDIVVPNPSSSYLYMLFKMCTCVYVNNNNVMERPEKQRVACNMSKTGSGADKPRHSETKCETRNELAV